MRSREARPATRLSALAKVVATLAALNFCFTSAMAVAQPRLAAIVVDADSGEVLYEYRATARWYPASLTKIMTVYLAFGEIERGRLALDDTITISEHAASMSPTKLGLAAGATITVENAIRATIIRSANDMAAALAEKIAGSEQGFALMMTTAARAIGMSRTIFRNASGLPDSAQTTTARDMAVLARAVLQNFPQYFYFFSQTALQHGGRSLPSYNALLARYPGADGMKTGFTCGSGYNIVGTAERDGRHLIAVLLGATSRNQRSAEVIRLFDLAFAVTGTGLSNIETLRHGDDNPPPPTVLSPDTCRTSTTPSTGIASIGNLPGWGILFGSFVSPTRAESVIKEARETVAMLPADATPAVVPRSREGVVLYTALIVGLEQAEAGFACKRLWDLGEYCLALTPDALNNPNALWR